MKQSVKKMVAVVGIGLTALACQPVLADGGWGHHRGGYGYGRGGGWVPSMGGMPARIVPP